MVDLVVDPAGKHLEGAPADEVVLPRWVRRCLLLVLSVAITAFIIEVPPDYLRRYILTYINIANS